MSITNYEDNMKELVELSKKNMPGLTGAHYEHIIPEVYSDGALDTKTKRLMSLAVAIQAGCKDCMIYQTSEALEHGAAADEIAETCKVAISMGGTLAHSKTLVVFDYLRSKGIID